MTVTTEEIWNKVTDKNVWKKFPVVYKTEETPVLGKQVERMRTQH